MRASESFCRSILLSIAVGFLLVTLTLTPTCEATEITADDAFAAELQKLAGTNAADRVKALEALNSLADSYVSELTPRYVESRAVPQLLEAVRSLGPEECGAILSILNKLLHEDGLFSEAALKITQDGLVDLVCDQNAYPQLKVAALLGIRRTLPLTKANSSALLGAVSSEPLPPIKQNIAGILIHDEKHNPAVRDKLDALAMSAETDTATRSAILTELKFRHGAPGSADPVLSQSLASDKPELRWQAMDSMMIAKYESASESDVATVMALVHDPKEPLKNRILATGLLGRIASTNRFPDELQTLLKMPQDRSIPTDIRVAAIRSVPFATHYSPKLLDGLRLLETDPIPSIAQAAHRAVSVIEDRNAERRKAIQSVTK